MTATDARHPLDRAAVNSKIVVTSDGPVFVSPTQGIIALSADDPARALPNGARIRKVAVGEFTAEQLNPAVERPPLVTTTALEAITSFLDHFHG